MKTKSGTIKKEQTKMLVAKKTVTRKVIKEMMKYKKMTLKVAQEVVS